VKTNIKPGTTTGASSVYVPDLEYVGESANEKDSEEVIDEECETEEE